jgi:hypothetical protein
MCMVRLSQRSIGCKFHDLTPVKSRGLFTIRPFGLGLLSVKRSAMGTQRRAPSRSGSLEIASLIHPLANATAVCIQTRCRWLISQRKKLLMGMGRSIGFCSSLVHRFVLRYGADPAGCKEPPNGSSNRAHPPKRGLEGENANTSRHDSHPTGAPVRTPLLQGKK